MARAARLMVVASCYAMFALGSGFAAEPPTTTPPPSPTPPPPSDGCASKTAQEVCPAFAEEECLFTACAVRSICVGDDPWGAIEWGFYGDMTDCNFGDGVLMQQNASPSLITTPGVHSVEFNWYKECESVDGPTLITLTLPVTVIDDCGCNQPPLVSAYTPPTATVHPASTIEICKGCTDVDCEDWPGDRDGNGTPNEPYDYVLALNISLQGVSDVDKVTYYSWVQDENCSCTAVSDGPHIVADMVEVTWSGSVDRCTPGAYTLTATLTNPTTNKVPLGGESGGNPCTQLVPITTQESTVISVTVIVKDFVPTYDPYESGCQGPHPPPLGVMTEATLHAQGQEITDDELCIKYTGPPGGTMLLVLDVQGGIDKDVCVLNMGSCPTWSEIEVDEEITWNTDLPGWQDPDNPRIYVASIPDPSAEPDGCAWYTVDGLVDDSGACNVGNEQRSASKLITVYTCVREIRSTTGDIWIPTLVANAPVVAPIPSRSLRFRYTFTSIYEKCNGDLVPQEQRLIVIPPERFAGSGFSFSHIGSHNFRLGSTQFPKKRFDRCDVPTEPSGGRCKNSK